MEKYQYHNEAKDIQLMRDVLCRGGWAFFDVDGTLQDENGIHPELISRLQLLNLNGVRTGICTGRSGPYLQRFYNKCGHQAEEIFSGGLVLEDGHVFVRPGLSLSEAEKITEQNVLEAIQAFAVYFLAHWQQTDFENGWGEIEGVPIPLVMPSPHLEQGSYSIWERGKKESPDYQNVMRWAESAVNVLGLGLIELFEVGNGSLRIIQPGITKGTGLELLQQEGYIDLSKTIFFGDANNDISAAKAVIDAGGVAVAVGNATQVFKEHVTHVTSLPSGAGIVQVINKILS